MGQTKPKKLTPAMTAALESIRDGQPWKHLFGRSAWGGATWTRKALIERGLITKNDELTDAGRAALPSN